MKKLIAMVTVLMLLASFFVSFAEPETIDLSTMSLEEIALLIQRAQFAMFETVDWQEVTVPAGIYQIGVDIPAGKWNVSMGKNWARIKIGAALNDTGNEVDNRSDGYYSVQLNEDVSSRDITFFEGMYVEIYNASLIFRPAVGATFSFK